MNCTAQNLPKATLALIIIVQISASLLATVVSAGAMSDLTRTIACRDPNLPMPPCFDILKYAVGLNGLWTIASVLTLLRKSLRGRTSVLVFALVGGIGFIVFVILSLIACLIVTVSML